MRRITPTRYLSKRLQEKHARLRAERPPRQEIPRLGDRIGSALESVGVTPERWAAAKAEIGLPATCGCASRREWLNKLDEKLGLAEGLEKFAGLLGWK
jgi:hypothetical protein